MSTWLVVALVVAMPFFSKHPLESRMVDLQESSAEDYGIQTQFDRNQIELSPAWHPDSPNPPLSASRALNIAEEYRKTNLIDNKPDPNFDTEWKLDSLRLKPLDSKNQKWCWEVLFVCDTPRSGYIFEFVRHRIFVDMNGLLFESTKTPPPDITIPSPAENAPGPNGKAENGG